MKLIIDAMGGDHAPLEIVKGALQGHKRLGVELVLTGDETAIMDAARKSGVETLPAGVSIRHTTEEVMSSFASASACFLR